MYLKFIYSYYVFSIALRFKGSIKEEFVREIVAFYVEFMKKSGNPSNILEAAISGLGTLLYHNKSAAEFFKETEGPSVVKAMTESSEPSLAELARAFCEMF